MYFIVFSREKQFKQMLRDLVLLTFAELWENALQYPADLGWIPSIVTTMSGSPENVDNLMNMFVCPLPRFQEYWENVWMWVSGTTFCVCVCVFKVLALRAGSSIIPNLALSRERQTIVWYIIKFGKTPTLFPQPVWY